MPLFCLKRVYVGRNLSMQVPLGLSGVGGRGRGRGRGRRRGEGAFEALLELEIIISSCKDEHLLSVSWTSSDEYFLLLLSFEELTAIKQVIYL